MKIAIPLVLIVLQYCHLSLTTGVSNKDDKNTLTASESHKDESYVELMKMDIIPQFVHGWGHHGWGHEKKCKEDHGWGHGGHGKFK